MPIVSLAARMLPTISRSAPADRSLPNSRSGPAVKGGPPGPSEASREAAPLTAGPWRLPAVSDPSRGRSAAALGQVRFEISLAESQGTSDLQVGKPPSACQVVDSRHRQAQQLGNLVGREQLAVERDDRVAHDGLRTVKADGSAASSMIGSAPTALAARRTASATGSVAWYRTTETFWFRR